MSFDHGAVLRPLSCIAGLAFRSLSSLLYVARIARDTSSSPMGFWCTRNALRTRWCGSLERKTYTFVIDANSCEWTLPFGAEIVILNMEKAAFQCVLGSVLGLSETILIKQSKLHHVDLWPDVMSFEVPVNSKYVSHCLVI